MDTIYKSDKYEDNWYLQVSVDEDGYGILEDVYNAGDVYEKRYLCNLWVNKDGSAWYDDNIHLAELDFLKRLFNNVKQIQ